MSSIVLKLYDLNFDWETLATAMIDIKASMTIF